MQRTPIGHRLVPGLSARRVGLAAKVFDGGVVHRHQPGTRARLDRHVAHGHPAFHRQCADGRATELDRKPCAAGRADTSDDGEHDVLGGHARTDLAIDPHQHGPRFLLQQALGSEHMLDLGRADTMRQTGEGPMSRSMGVAAHYGHTWQRCAVLGADHMHDTLALVTERKVGQRTELTDVGVQSLDLRA